MFLVVLFHQLHSSNQTCHLKEIQISLPWTLLGTRLCLTKALETIIWDQEGNMIKLNKSSSYKMSTSQSDSRLRLSPKERYV